jgi:hypothetical protein
MPLEPVYPNTQTKLPETLPSVPIAPQSYDASSGGTNYGAIGGGLLSLAGLWGSANSIRPRSFEVYDPAQTALSRYRELIDPGSGYNRRLQSLYQKYFAEGSPTINSLLGVSRAAGIDSGTSAALAFQKGQEISNTNNEQVLTSLQREMLNAENSAQGYLGLHYKMLQDKATMNFQESQRASEGAGSFFNQLLGLGGTLLGKAIS